MTTADQKKIAYLFGAGATHAELAHIGADLTAVGLLMSNVTRRVTIKASETEEFLVPHRMFLERAADSSNIELFISLIEDNAYEIQHASNVIDQLKELVEADIKEILTAERLDAFVLHKAFFELHRNNGNEILIGIISLNYDTVLDDAYRLFHDVPDYFSDTPGREGPKLLKLHGSFNWRDIEVNGRRRTIPIMPLGINKNYLRWPYNFIWGRALEILAACDILRVIGCSLSANDVELIDLIFKAHVQKGSPIEIQIISSEETGQAIKSRYDFFPKITTAEKIEETLLPDVKRGTNVFKEWLRAKGTRVLTEESIAGTTYLKSVIL